MKYMRDILLQIFGWVVAILLIVVLIVGISRIYEEQRAEMYPIKFIIGDETDPVWVVDGTDFTFGQFEQITADEIDASVIKWDDEKKMFYTEAKQEIVTEYERGFKDALESLALLALELNLKNERKTYGEMFDILYERHQIRRIK